MATDRSDFQRRKKYYGKFFNELREGADSTRLAKLLVKAMEREIRNDRPLPMLGEVIRELDSRFEFGSLFQIWPDSLPELFKRLDEIGSRYAEFSATRDVIQCGKRVANDLARASSRRRVPDVRRSISEMLMNLWCLDPAHDYGKKHRGLSEDQMHMLKVAIRAHAITDVTEMIDATVRSSGGKPGKWRKEEKPEPIEHTRVSLADEVLAPLT